MKKYKDALALILTVVLLVMAVPVNVLATNKSESDQTELQKDTLKLSLSETGNIAEGVIDENYGHITWIIDKDGKLILTGTGDVRSSQSDEVPWKAYKKSIISAEVNVMGMTDVCDLLSGCSNMVSLDLSGFNTEKVTDMAEMFSGCSSLSSLDLSNFDTSNVTDMSSMFYNCSKLNDLNLKNFDTSSVMDMYKMFEGCSSLKSLDLSNFDTSCVSDMWRMFADCSSIISLDLSSFNSSSVKLYNMEGMFLNCRSLMTIYTPYNVMGVSELPFDEKSEFWCLPDGEKLTKLPQSQDYSVMITRMKKKNISSARISLANNQFEYTGLAVSPEITVQCDGKLLSKDMDYVVSYGNNIQPGIADIIIQGIGDYMGTLVTHFTIIEEAIDIENSDMSSQPGSPKKGDKYVYKDILYRVLTFDETEGTVEAVSANKKSLVNADVADTVKINVYSFKVVSVKSNAFAGCTKLKSVKLGKNVSSIGKKAFQGCTALVSVNIPAGVTKLEDSTFNNCKKLKTVSGCTGITTVGSKVFYKCEKLVTVGNKGKVLTLKKVKTIGSSAFYGCKSVKKVNLTSTALTEIGDSAFQNCTSMTSFTSKSPKLTGIGKKAFYGDKKLGTVSLKTEKLKKSKVGSSAFKGIKSTCKFKVPKKQVSTYKKIFKAKGGGSKLKVSSL